MYITHVRIYMRHCLHAQKHNLAIAKPFCNVYIYKTCNKVAASPHAIYILSTYPSIKSSPATWVARTIKPELHSFLRRWGTQGVSGTATWWTNSMEKFAKSTNSWLCPFFVQYPIWWLCCTISLGISLCWILEIRVLGAYSKYSSALLFPAAKWLTQEKCTDRRVKLVCEVERNRSQATDKTSYTAAYRFVSKIFNNVIQYILWKYPSWRNLLTLNQ